MKKIFTFLLLFMVIGLFTVEAQRAPLDVTRNLVVVEIGTGTWCGYCPGAAMGADDLVHDGHPVAIVENHNGDAYTNDYSNARNNLYAITGYPTALFDGGLAVVGGSSTATMYSSYLPKVNVRMNVQTPFDVDFTFTSNGSDNYTAIIDIAKLGDYASDVVLHLFVTESHIPENWGIMTELNFVNRLMVPDQNGTALDFSSGNNLVEELSFNLDPSWDRDECEIVIAVQDMSTKEILNGAMVPMLQPDFQYDAILTNVIFPTEQACDGEVAPRLEVKNYGSEMLTSLDVEYMINNGDLAIYNWTGSLGFTQSEIIVLPAIEFIGEPTNTLDISLTNPNGVADENPSDNSAAVDFETAAETSGDMSMELFVGTSMSFQISWALKNSMGEVIADGSGYSNGDLIEMDLPVDATDCYDFFLYDSGGNGFQGYGYLKLFDGEELIVEVINDFGEVENITFHADLGTGIDQITNNNLSIYPNPAQESANINYTLENNSNVSIEVYSLLGSKVFETTPTTQNVGEQNFILHTASLEEGIYFVNLKINNETITKKITVIK